MVYPIRGSAKPLVDKQPAHACPYNKRRRLVVYYPTIKRILLIPNRGNILNAYIPNIFQRYSFSHETSKNSPFFNILNRYVFMNRLYLAS